MLISSTLSLLSKCPVTSERSGAKRRTFVLSTVLYRANSLCLFDVWSRGGFCFTLSLLCAVRKRGGGRRQRQRRQVRPAFPS